VGFSRRAMILLLALFAALCALSAALFRFEDGRAASRLLPTAREADRLMLVANALRWIGTPYAYGADGPSTMDCSGFVHRVVVESGSLPPDEAPRKSADFASVGRSVSGEIRPGDILLFSFRGRVDHVAIALSSDSFINAVSQGPRRGVVISSLSEACWKDSFAGARRIGKEMK